MFMQYITNKELYNEMNNVQDTVRQAGVCYMGSATAAMAKGIDDNPVATSRWKSKTRYASLYSH